VGPARLFDSLHELLPLVVPSWPTYVVLSDYFSLQGCILIQITVIPSDMGNTCSLQSFHSNSTSLCCYDNFMNVDGYSIVMAYDNHNIIVTFSCLD
jgi:hypothetical protein